MILTGNGSDFPLSRSHIPGTELYMFRHAFIEIWNRHTPFHLWFIAENKEIHAWGRKAAVAQSTDALASHISIHLKSVLFLC